MGDTAFLFLLLAAAVVIAGVRWIAPDPVSALTLYSLVTMLMFVVRPAILLLGLDAFRVPKLLVFADDQLLRDALLLFTMSHIVMLSGYLGGRRYFASSLVRVLPRFPHPAQARLLQHAAMALALITGTAYVALIYRHGGVSQIMNAARTGELAGLQLLNMLFYVASTIAAFALALARREKQPTIVLRSGAVLVLATGISFMTGDRSAAVAPYLILVALLEMQRGGGRTGRLVCTALAAIVILGMLNGIRGQVMTGNRVASTSNDQQYHFAESLTGSCNLQQFDYFVTVMQDVQTGYLDLRYGGDYLRGVVGMVPRALWPGKPEVISEAVWFSEHYFKETDRGRPFTGLGVWLLNFGFVGAFAGMFFTGIVLSSLDRYRGDSLSERNYWKMLVFCVLIFNVFLGGVGPAVPVRFVQALVPILLVYWAISLAPSGAGCRELTGIAIKGEANGRVF